jgi:hypothetical protein
VSTDAGYSQRARDDLIDPRQDLDPVVFQPPRLGPDLTMLALRHANR